MLFNHLDPALLKRLSLQISEKYRYGLSLNSEEEILAYLIVRMPATLAVLRRVFFEIPSPGSILDLGAGPGTSYWAAKELWDRVSITGYEQQLPFIEWGKKMGSQVDWQKADFLKVPSFEPHDWVLMSYSLAELPEESYASLMQKCWAAAQKGIILVEPGTPRGSQNILSARSLLIDLGGFVAAPCPHNNVCPMLGSKQWCHFSVRLERSFYHRLAKGAELPYEDEKFSYVIVTKEPQAVQNRIIHSPQQRSGHTNLSLCTPEGLTQKVISRRHKELYRKARDSAWGDTFPEI